MFLSYTFEHTLMYLFTVPIRTMGKHHVTRVTLFSVDRAKWVNNIKVFAIWVWQTVWHRKAVIVFQNPYFKGYVWPLCNTAGTGIRCDILAAQLSNSLVLRSCWTFTQRIPKGHETIVHKHLLVTLQSKSKYRNEERTFSMLDQIRENRRHKSC